ncbi:MAG: hypothetical protein COS82_09395 [Zetaproteobacteria bacterium CG06_land_8_20_14_3_00_59_53]|nr:MAG: hypothetical protein AUK36_09905 [Zetaproteobacteria bacterium CG2_30_59_37]PIO90757.1 MAG: hypothetical protein COX56_01065 [Zetaproteobacteria bacterium CG23_combo_of_CG06-09_8_20_14_all_59_86]PIQ65329.1 MAG: hypothetical protein COV97_04665 [Zetaproteobacteria bacterium CG11_big_fil_rev_8_21_14_0_20_59_439]PIU69871.1 MAG: hypothetical protein COS82_09395 [Zetaproteobacteria bacterium CG06_land_8_20_14_3_00_59_53]PIU97397.1 MAG: hypothetical protein COS62_04105 [Zetaproteobacteria bac
MVKQSAMLETQLHEAIETLSLLRTRMLRTDPKNAELRSSFREISHHLESIRQLNPVSSEEFRQFISWLSMFLQADFGMNLRQYQQLGDSERDALIEHINQRRQLLLQAENDVPLLHTVIGTCLMTLNAASDSEASGSIEKQARQLAKTLNNHLREDEKLHKALQAFISAMQQSLEKISSSLGDMGGQIPELAETQNILNAELPADPKMAQALLLKARANILRAGQKVGQAGKAISQALKSQQAQMQEMSENLNRAEFDALHDPLTGLGNRRKLGEMFKSLGNRSAAFLIIDVDHFKKINDRYGHDAGDDVLVGMARILTGNVRATDMVVRLGGEEFAAVLPEVSADNAFTIAETLRGAIEAGSFKTRKGEIQVTTSIGLASRKPDEPVSHWIGRGDVALYQAKSNGRNRTEVSLD